MVLMKILIKHRDTDCPEVRHKRVGDETYDMCNLNGKSCLVEHGLYKCDYYNDYLKAIKASTDEVRVMKYKILDDDEVMRVKFNQAPFSIRLTCCDCGLTHDVKMLKYEGLEEDEVEMIFSRNKRCTGKQRKKRICRW